MGLFDFIKRLFCKELPLWSYGLECHICQMTFINEQAHYDYVMENNLYKKHINKIPILK